MSIRNGVQMDRAGSVRLRWLARSLILACVEDHDYAGAVDAANDAARDIEDRRDDETDEMYETRYWAEYERTLESREAEYYSNRRDNLLRAFSTDPDICEGEMVAALELIASEPGWSRTIVAARIGRHATRGVAVHGFGPNWRELPQLAVFPSGRVMRQFARGAA